MPYSSYPDRCMPYHIDGSIVKYINSSTGVIKSLSAAEMLEANDNDYVKISWGGPSTEYSGKVTVFFPELRDVSGIFAVLYYEVTIPPYYYSIAMASLQGSADTTNGLDGTWVDATMSGGYPVTTLLLDDWRKGIKPVTGLTGVRAIRFGYSGAQVPDGIYILHVYGKKTVGETPDDIIFLDAEAADAEFSKPLDYGDRPAGTSAQHQVKIKNASATKTANSIVLTAVDPADMVRLSDSAAGPWNTTFNVASLAAGAKSATIYIKYETPAPPTPLGPTRVPIKVEVGSWT